MRTKIHFDGIEGFEHHRNFVESAIDSTLGRFDAGNSGAADIKVRKIVSRGASSGGVEFRIELLMRMPGNKTQIFLKKDATDLYLGVKELCRAAQKILRRNSKTKAKLRRRLAAHINYRFEQEAA